VLVAMCGAALNPDRPASLVVLTERRRGLKAVPLGVHFPCSAAIVELIAALGAFGIDDIGYSDPLERPWSLLDGVGPAPGCSRLTGSASTGASPPATVVAIRVQGRGANGSPRLRTERTVMSLARCIRPVHRVAAVLVGVGLAAGAVVFAATGASAGSTASRPAAGTIHVFGVNTSLTSSTTEVLITGAFSDHGAGKQSTWHLTKGAITFNTSKLNATLNSPSFGTFYPASCSFSGVAKVAVPIRSGTKAYAGIKGTITVTATVAEEGSLLKNGKCNEASNAPLVGVAAILTGFGKVSF